MTSASVGVEAVGTQRRVVISGLPLTAVEARELEIVFEQMAEDRDDIHVVTLISAGPDFCPGAAADLDPLTCGSDPAAAIAAFPGPVVVAMRGVVSSVGLELALAADLRIADATARFALPDVADGRLPCWGGTQRLPRLAGRSVAARMLLAGEELDAAAAAACGLVHQVATDLAATAGDTAGRLDALAPLALAAAKEALARGPELTMRHALELEGDLNHLLQTTTDRAEGLAAFFGKRAPRFTGA